MSWKCMNCGKENPGNLNLCECGHQWSIGDPAKEPSLPLPRWIKRAACILFPLCMFAGGAYFRCAAPDSPCAGPFGLLAGAAAVPFIIGIVFVLQILQVHIAERQWIRIKPLIMALAALIIASIAGYCLVGWQGVFGSWVSVAGVGLIIFCTRELVRRKYDEKTGEDATRDVGLVIIGLVICVFMGVELHAVWKEQHEKTGRAWYVSVLMSGPQEEKTITEQQ